MPTTATGKATDFITFTRASNATVTDSDGKIKWAPHNLLTNSESFDASAWTKGDAAVTANSIAAPNGTTTADLIKPSATTQPHIVYSGVVSAASLTYGAFVKANGYTKVALRESATSGTGAAFDLSGSGSVIGVYDAGSSTASNASIAALASGWFYISCTVTFASASSHSLGVCVLSPSYTSGNLYASWLANGTDGIYVWGAHLYRSDLGGMQANTSAYPMYNSTTPKNLLGYTEDFSNAAWVKNNILAFGSGSVANAVLAPNGLQTADLVVPNTISNYHAAYAPSALSAGVTYVASIYAKAGGYDKVVISDWNEATRLATFDLTNGTAVLSGSGATVTLSNAVISPVGNGWYRCSVQIAKSTAGQLSFFINAASVFTGDGTSGIYLWGAQLSDSASLDAYVPSYGAAPTSAAYYGPRRDFDAVTLACKGLLVEEARTNLLLQSNGFDTASWTKTRSSAAFVSGTAPDGSTTIAKITEDSTASESHLVQISATVVNGTTYTWTVYAKAGERTWLCLYNSNVTQGKFFNLSTGALGSNFVGAPAASSITPVGNGWYRCSISFAATSTSATLIHYLATADNTAVYTGDGTSGLYLYGAQLEAGSFATSYIPTGSATATRAADVASVSTQAFPYNATEGTLVVQSTIRTWSSTAYPTHVSLNDGTGNNLIVLYHTNAGATAAEIYTSGAQEFTRALGTVSDNATVKMAIAYKSDSTQAARDGTASTVDTSSSIPSVTKLDIAQYANSQRLNGWVRQITYIPRRLTAAELQSRTA